LSRNFVSFFVSLTLPIHSPTVNAGEKWYLFHLSISSVSSFANNVAPDQQDLRRRPQNRTPRGLGDLFVQILVISESGYQLKRSLQYMFRLFFSFSSPGVKSSGRGLRTDRGALLAGSTCQQPRINFQTTKQHACKASCSFPNTPPCHVLNSFHSSAGMQAKSMFNQPPTIKSS